MKLQSITVHKYRGISEDISITLKHCTGVLPVLGINESGKTSLLQAISAFDHRNDEVYPEHLINVKNRNDKKQRNAEISVVIDIAANEHADAKNVNIFKFLSKQTRNAIRKIKILRTIYNEASNGVKSKYSIIYFAADNGKIETGSSTIPEDDFAKLIINDLTRILYFPDFGGRIVENFTISKIEKNNMVHYTHSSNQNYMFFLFLLNLINDSISFQDLFDEQKIDEFELASIEQDINTVLNTFIIEKWNKLQGDDGASNNLSIELKLFRYAAGAELAEKIEGAIQKDASQVLYIKFNIKENSSYFPINERSKGFLWFINFVFQTQLDPNILNKNCMYLFDEPGCYLHSSAQTALCQIMMEIGRENLVIYNTHSHYMLDFSFLPNVKLMKKKKSGISLVNYGQNLDSDTNIKLAYQPIYDCLKLEPEILTKMVENFSTIFIVEGKTDFHVFEKFVEREQRREIGFIPSTGAQNIPIQVATFYPFKKVFGIFDGDNEAKHIMSKYPDYHEHFVMYDKGKVLEDYLDDEEWQTYAREHNITISQPITNSDKKSLLKIMCSDGNFNIGKFPKTQERIMRMWERILERIEKKVK